MGRTTAALLQRFQLAVVSAEPTPRLAGMHGGIRIDLLRITFRGYIGIVDRGDDFLLVLHKIALRYHVDVDSLSDGGNYGGNTKFWR